MNCEAYSSFEGVSSDHRIVTAKIRLSLRKNAKRTETTKHYDWALLNNRDIRDKYVLELRNRFETLQEKTEKVHQTTNMKISSMRTSRQQRNAFQQNSKLNIESHGKRLTELEIGAGIVTIHCTALLRSPSLMTRLLDT